MLSSKIWIMYVTKLSQYKRKFPVCKTAKLVRKHDRLFNKCKITGNRNICASCQISNLLHFITSTIKLERLNWYFSLKITICKPPTGKQFTAWIFLKLCINFIQNEMYFLLFLVNNWMRWLLHHSLGPRTYYHL